MVGLDDLNDLFQPDDSALEISNRTGERAFLPKLKMDLLSDYSAKPLPYFISLFKHVKMPR